MAPEVNILLTCVGRRVSLLYSFRRAMADLGVRGKIYGSDWSALAPAFYEADEGFWCPASTQPQYVDILIDLCRRHNVGLVIPLVDTELLTLSQAHERFTEAGAGSWFPRTRRSRSAATRKRRPTSFCPLASAPPRS